jgi:transporter family-2 protein
MLDVFRWLGLPLLATLAGTSLVMQATLNASLRSDLGSWSWAALVSYLGGTLAMVLLVIIRREPFPAREVMTGLPWTAWIGGLFGAIYIATSIVLVPRLGAAAVVVFVVAGQMLTSLAFDHYGLMGLPQHPATLARLAGAVLLVISAILMRA